MTAYVTVPDKKCLFCKKEFNRTRLKSGKLERVRQFAKRKYCCRTCYNKGRLKPFLTDLHRCLFCGSVMLRTYKNDGKMTGHKEWKRRRFCNRDHWRKFWKMHKGKENIWSVFQKGKTRYSVSRVRKNGTGS